MGAYAPAPVCTPELQARILTEVLEPTMKGFIAEGMPYLGLLYAGVMLTKDGPMLLEYNCRFGDPETQVLLSLLDSDLFEVALGCAEGDLAARVPEVQWKSGAAATVVCAATGYPNSYPKGLPISGLAEANSLDDVKVYHAGTKQQGGGHVTTGGRVLAVTGKGADFKEALRRAYAGVEKITFEPKEGLHCRRDIGHRALHRPTRIGLVGSTRGSSSQATIDAIKAGAVNAEIVVIVSNKKDA